MLRINTKIIEQPIILIQDTCQGNISTTDDILDQLNLHQYSPLLKNVNLDHFMQLTEEKDFEQYGIRKQKDCRRLSKCADSIRRTSFSSSISSVTSINTMDDSTEDNTMVTHKRVSFVSLSPPPMSPEEDETKQLFTFRTEESDDDEEEDDDDLVWPNSIKKRNPPNYVEDHRRYSLPSLTPPEYADSILDKRRNNSFSEGSTYKAPGEGKEKLPGYTCTVQKMGRGIAKIEYTSPGIRSLLRPWKDIYIELQGTLLKIFEFEKSNIISGGYRYLPTLKGYYQEPLRYILLYTIPLAEAKAEVPSDYTKRKHVFRITSKHGPQILIQVQTNVSVSSWIEKLAAGSNIAVDLEHQRMPHFTSLPTEPYHGWVSTSDTLQRYQTYVNEELAQRNLSPLDPLI